MLKRRLSFPLYVLIALLGLTFCIMQVQIAQAQSQSLCVKKKITTAKNRTVYLAKNMRVVSGDSCPKGYAKLLNTSSFIGPQGPTGETGAQGSAGESAASLVYGDGSDGDVVFNSNQTLEPNKEYGNITIDSGVTLSVKSGTVIRCTGTFTNNGTLSVSTYTYGAARGGAYNSGSLDKVRNNSGHPGISRVNSANGEFGTGSIVGGNLSASSMDENTAAAILKPGPWGGGGGGSGAGDGGAGGGTVTVLCKEGIENSSAGIIRANAGNGSTNGAGGGGGGIIILASASLISNAGAIQAKGGNGGDASAFSGNGGGGGGGIIHFLAPSLNLSGTTTVTGGTGASGTTSKTFTPSSGGGSGGSCAGLGGDGGAPGASPAAADSGSDGIVIQTLTDPSRLF